MKLAAEASRVYRAVTSVPPRPTSTSLITVGVGEEVSSRVVDEVVVV
jgi:hypothetical protein